MLYEIRFEANGCEGQRQVVADSDAEALAKFRRDWEEYGDEAPAEPWIVGRWTQE